MMCTAQALEGEDVHKTFGGYLIVGRIAGDVPAHNMDRV